LAQVAAEADQAEVEVEVYTQCQHLAHDKAEVVAVEYIPSKHRNQVDMDAPKDIQVRGLYLRLTSFCLQVMPNKCCDKQDSDEK
jgi:hypothetical protein